MDKPELESSPAATGTATMIYILYLTGLMFGVTGVIGMVMAYVNIDDAPAWLRSHYQFQIRTFWIGAIYIVSGAVLALILVGYLILAFWALWLIVRCAKGMKYLNKQQAHPNPTGWLF